MNQEKLSTDLMKDSTISNGIIYNGLVKISYLNGKDIVKTNVIKNTGTELFFKYLTKAVCGVDVAENMPRYLDIGVTTNKNNIGGTENYVPKISVRRDLTSKYVTKITIGDTPINSAACFTAIIPGNTILKTSGNTYADTVSIYNDYSASVIDSRLAVIYLPEDS